MSKTLHRDSWDQYVSITEKQIADQRAEIERLTAENERQFKATTEDQEIIARLLAENGRLIAGIKWVLDNIDHKKAPLVVGRLRFAMRGIHQQETVCHACGAVKPEPHKDICSATW